MQVHDGAVLPQPLKRVENAVLLVLDVDHHVRIVEKYPASGGPPLATHRPKVLLEELLFDAVDDGVDLAFAGCRSDQEDIREGKAVADVQSHNVLGNLVCCGLRCMSGCGNG